MSTIELAVEDKILILSLGLPGTITGATAVLGNPTDGSLNDGAVALTSQTKIVDAVDLLNEEILERGIRRYATEAALLVATPSNGTIGYAEDTHNHWFRKNGGWQDYENAGVVFYATEVALLAAAPANGTIGYAQDTHNHWFRRNGAWADDESDGRLDALEAADVALDGRLDALELNRRTSEALAPYIDPVAGVDPPAGTTFYTQAQLDAYKVANNGFKTLAAVYSALPHVIAHSIIPTVKPGTYAVDQTWLGDASHLEIEATGGIINVRPEGDALTRIAGTSTYPVASSTSEVITLASDPGFTVDQHKKTMVRVVSGTGSGQIKSLATHTGVALTVAGRFSPVLDATSVIELCVPSVTLQFSAAASPLLGGPNNQNTPNSVLGTLESHGSRAGAFGSLVFTGIKFENLHGSLWFFSLRGLTGVDQCIIKHFAVSPFSLSQIRYGVLICDGNGTDSIIISMIGTLQSGSVSSSLLIIDGTSAGLLLSALPPTLAVLSNVRVQNCSRFARAIGSGRLSLSTFCRGGNLSDVGIRLEKGAVCEIPIADVAVLPTGTNGAFTLDGTTIATWAELDAVADDWMEGLRGSRIGSSSQT